MTPAKTVEAPWVNRLRNWKFAEALKALPKDHPLREMSALSYLEALAGLFEDPGWAIGGHMADLVEAAVRQILLAAGEKE